MMNSNSYYKREMKDDRAVYLKDGNFGICADGLSDNTRAIQDAVEYVWKTNGFGIVFLPEGTYRVSDTIYMPKAVRLIGYGENRPVIELCDNAPGYDREHTDDKGKSKYVFWFTDNVPNEKELVRDANPGTFYSSISNIDIHIGEGNPYAVALRTHYAQHSFIAHMDIYTGAGRAAIYDCGNEMEDIRMFGGDYGIITTKCSPGWPFVMVDTYFEGQRKAAIASQEGGLTIIRTVVKNTPVFLETRDGYMEKLYLEDASFENIWDCAIEMEGESNSVNQYNIRNLDCCSVPVLVRFKESGRTLESADRIYKVREFVHGICVSDADKDREMVTQCSMEPLAAMPSPVPTDIPVLPPAGEWVSIKDMGACGDGKTDDTEAVRRAVASCRCLYIPEGWYIIKDTITLREDSVLIGLNPIATQFKLPDNTEGYTGFGNPKAVIEAPKGGSCIVTGIGIDTGGRNPRAVGCKWMAGEHSYMNDVKFIGGHGTMEWGSNRHIMPYNETRTADADPKKMWDAQYPSLWVAAGGGGVFKDVWSASTYAAAGFMVSNTDTRGRVYCMSLEHHMRQEAYFYNVSNWNLYGLQTEEEKAEGRNALPLQLDRCRDMMFANLYMFRVVYVTTPFPYCIKTTDCERLEFLNVHNFSQMKYTMDNTILDVNTALEVRPWQMARCFLSGTAVRKPMDLGEARKLYGGFYCADGGCVNSKGDFYFLDSTDKKIYKIDGGNLKLTMVCTLPVKVNSLGVDTKDQLLAAGEYVIPADASVGGKMIENPLPEDAAGSSYGYWYNKRAQVVVFAVKEGQVEEPVCLLERRELSDMEPPEKIIYAGNRWRDSNDFKEVVTMASRYGYIAPDGVTVIPGQYDLIRANCLGEAFPGRRFYCVDEYYKRVYGLDVDAAGRLSNPRVIIEEGDFCVSESPDGLLYVCDSQIRVYDREGSFIREIQVPERPSTIGFGGRDRNILFITARTGVYALKI